MSLYLNLKDHIIRQILDGIYTSGDLLPTELELSSKHELSRVTVRKALQELKNEGVVSSVQGQGTAVSHRSGGYESSLDLISLVSAVHNPFFASFMEHFEKSAEENGSLVLFKQDFQGNAFQSKELYFRFIQKNIRNVVFWPQAEHIDFTLLKHLRSVGMNLVIFDQIFETDIADIVCVNHQHAVHSLYNQLCNHYDGKIIYIGYHGVTLASVTMRESAFIEVCSKEHVYTIPWGQDIESSINKLFQQLETDQVLPAAVLCSNGPIGIATAKYIRNKYVDYPPIAAIDFLPEMTDYRIIAYRQPMKKLAEKAYQCLVEQNGQGELWKAHIYELEGEIVHYE